jgi:hypothetical protein
MKEMEKVKREKNMKLFYKIVNTTKQQFKPRTSMFKDKEGKMIGKNKASSGDVEIILINFWIRK